jgi:hypothetical protein
MRTLTIFTRLITLVVMASLFFGSLCVPKDAIARQVRGNTRMNVNRDGNFNRNKIVNRRDNINKNININRNTNVNINRDVNVRRYGRHGYHGDYHYRNDDGIGVGAAIAIGVAGLAVGSIITAASLPPILPNGGGQRYDLPTLRQYVVPAAIHRIAGQLCRRQPTSIK